MVWNYYLELGPVGVVDRDEGPVRLLVRGLDVLVRGRGLAERLVAEFAHVRLQSVVPAHHGPNVRI